MGMKREQVLRPTTASRRVNYRGTLTAEERAEVDQRIRTGTGAARKRAHARRLVKADEPPGGRGWTAEPIAAAVAVRGNTVARVRERVVVDGGAAAPTPPPRVAAPTDARGAAGGPPARPAVGTAASGAGPLDVPPAA